jgi:class 3 adenylate cyclase/CHASE2 domain-containing sensor protein
MSVQKRPLASLHLLSSPWPLIVIFAGTLMLWILILGDPFEAGELRWLDQVLRWRTKLGLAPAVDSHIIHLDVTGQDLQGLHSLSQEYESAARIIRESAALGAKVIVFDIIFARGDKSEAQPILDAIANVRPKSAQVVLAEEVVPGAADLRGPDLIRSFPFAERHRPAGLINVSADADGVLRHYPLVQPVAGQMEPSLGLAAYLAWRRVAWEDEPEGKRKSRVQVTTSGVIQWLELNADGKTVTHRNVGQEPALLNFRMSWNGEGKAAFRHYLVSQLDEEYAKAQATSSETIVSGIKPFDDCVVFVSYIAPGVSDVGATALGTDQPRVLLHSVALNDLIQDSFLRRTSRLIDASLILSMFVFGFCSRRCRGVSSLLTLWVCGLAVIVSLDFWLVLSMNLVMGTVCMAVVWSCATIGEITRRYMVEFVERLRLWTTMGLYFSPRVMQEVLKDPGSMAPKEAELILLLTDLRNSTPMAEKLGARRTFSLLNDVFEIQTRAVMGEDGNLEHFLGDQFLSYWGAPQRQADAADRALRAAYALIEGMENYRLNLSDDLRELFAYGVALHGGRALVGNKGSSLRLDYGVVGDLVNTAARAESLTKYYGVRMLVTREFYVQLSNRPNCRLVDRVIVKGKTTPIDLLELRNPGTSAETEETWHRYSEAFGFYQAGEFGRASQAFQRLAEEGTDPPSDTLMKRCVELTENPPLNWEGVYRLETK